MDIVHGFFANPDLQATLGNLILALAAFLATVIASAATGFIRSKTTDQQFDTLQRVAGAAVLAAEQAGLTGKVTDKKASAINVVNSWLLANHITGFTAQQVDAAIETAVATQLNANRIFPNPFAFPVAPLPTPEPSETETPAA